MPQACLPAARTELFPLPLPPRVVAGGLGGGRAAQRRCAWQSARRDAVRVIVCMLNHSFLQFRPFAPPAAFQRQPNRHQVDMLRRLELFVSLRGRGDGRAVDLCRRGESALEHLGVLEDLLAE